MSKFDDFVNNLPTGVKAAIVLAATGLALTCVALLLGQII